MKKLLLFVSFLFLDTSFVRSQNLVLNPGFEMADSLRYFASSGWFVPTTGTTDFFKLPTQRDLNFFGGRTVANSGKGFSGFILYQTSSHDRTSAYREFLTGTLSKSLTKGATYHISFFLQLGKKCNVSAGDLQIWFSSRQPEKTLGPNPTKDDPQLSISLSSVNAAQGKWTEVTADYTAEGGELYFTIGNFLSDNKTTVQKMKVPSQGSHPWAYYYLDDFLIGIPVSDTGSVSNMQIGQQSDFTRISDDTLKSLEPTDTLNIEAGKTIVPNTVYFGTDSSILKTGSFPVLDEIISAMQKQPELKVEIDGHTDANGTPKHNEDLSLARANAVADYFISHGIEKTRVSTKGFGSSKPVVTEYNDADRAKNRRVEFIFSK